MAKAIMVQGTMSSAGKSFIVTGLCRYYTNKGYRVAPFKSQNMALNSFVTHDGLEMGRAQVVQAEACKKRPSVLMNPILLKPTTDVGSQVIVEGKVVKNMRAREYFEYKKSLVDVVKNAYETLAKENDIIIVEGAGSPAEINLRDNDIVNMGLAEMLDIPVVLVGDIDPGGVFAQLHGTLSLIDDGERERIKGLIINKFRGDKKLLMPGIKMLEERCEKKVLGVVPMVSADIEQEDSITSAFNKKRESDSVCDIAVIKLPRISNFTDFDAFKIIDGVSIRYVEKVTELNAPDLIVIPGTKSTISDLRWMKQNGLFRAIQGFAREVPIVGICGGYQMLGISITDPNGVEGGGSESGLGFIPMTTVLEKEKVTTQVNGTFSDERGIFEFLNGKVFEGYEIHNGKTTQLSGVRQNNVLGTYVHGVFDSPGLADELVKKIAERKGISITSNTDYSKYKDEQYNLIADTLAQALDFDEIDKIIGL